MIGEFGGIGAFQEGHMWTPKGCHTYLVRPHLRRCPPCAEYPGSALTRAVRWRAQHAPTAANESATYVAMVDKIIEERASVSYSVYTQTTDLENECDGFLNYDRVNKFSDAGTKAIHDANQKLVGTPTDCVEIEPSADPGQDHVLNYKLY